MDGIINLVLLVLYQGGCLVAFFVASHVRAPIITAWGLSLSREGRIFIVGHCMWFHVFLRLEQTLAQMTRGILAWLLFFTNNRTISSCAPVLRYDQGMGLALTAGLVSVCVLWRVRRLSFSSL